MLALSATAWLGFFSYKNVEFRSDFWWQFGLHANAPRFLRAMVGAAGLSLAVALSRIMQPGKVKPAGDAHEQMERARSLLEASQKAASNLALLGDKSFLFSSSGQSFLMYGIQGRSWIAMGDPVGPRDEWAELVWAFRELADQYHGRVVFYEIDGEYLSPYLDLGLTLYKIGEEARVPLESFSLEGAGRKGMRRVKNSVEREGGVFELVKPEAVSQMLPSLKEISDKWLAEKKTREKSFSLGFFNERYIRQFPCAVVKLGCNPVAFANLFSSGGREELSVDLMRYLSTAPQDVMEYLFIELMSWGKEQGWCWFNLGMAPLSGLEARPLSPMWQKLGSLIYNYGEHFYNFEGLRAYKEKFHPVWKPKYLACPGKLNLPVVLADIGTRASGSLGKVLLQSNDSIFPLIGTAAQTGMHLEN